MKTPREIISERLAKYKFGGTDDILSDLDAAGYAIVPKVDLAPLWHLYEANRIVGNVWTTTLNAARDGSKVAEKDSVFLAA